MLEKLSYTINHFYYTRFYRSQSEMEIIKQRRDIECSDFKREMVMGIYLADKILNLKLKRCYNSLELGVLLMIFGIHILIMHMEIIMKK